MRSFELPKSFFLSKDLFNVITSKIKYIDKCGKTRSKFKIQITHSTRSQKIEWRLIIM